MTFAGRPAREVGLRYARLNRDRNCALRPYGDPVRYQIGRQLVLNDREAAGALFFQVVLDRTDHAYRLHQTAIGTGSIHARLIFTRAT
jgi:hypothetical protein